MNIYELEDGLLTTLGAPEQQIYCNLSIAISLKRIADSLEKQNDFIFTNESADNALDTSELNNAIDIMIANKAAKEHPERGDLK